MSYRFEFDEAKSRSNRVKHGIDFVDAQDLWLDPDLVRLEARSLDEPRVLFIGMIGSRHWSVIATYRDDAIRIISVRRSRTREVELYEGEGSR